MTGVFGVLLNSWLFATFVHSRLLVFKSHILVLNLCSASLGRNLLGFPFAGSSAIFKRWALVFNLNKIMSRVLKNQVLCLLTLSIGTSLYLQILQCSMESRTHPFTLHNIQVHKKYKSCYCQITVVYFVSDGCMVLHAVNFSHFLINSLVSFKSLQYSL